MSSNYHRLGQMSITRTVAHNHLLIPGAGNLMPSSGPSDSTYMHRHECRQSAHTHKTNLKKMRTTKALPQVYIYTQNIKSFATSVYLYVEQQNIYTQNNKSFAMYQAYDLRLDLLCNSNYHFVFTSYPNSFLPGKVQKDIFVFPKVRYT